MGPKAKSGSIPAAGGMPASFSEAIADTSRPPCREHGSDSKLKKKMKQTSDGGTRRMKKQEKNIRWGNKTNEKNKKQTQAGRKKGR